MRAAAVALVGRGEVTEARVERRQVLRVTGLALTGAVRARRPKDKEEKRDAAPGGVLVRRFRAEGGLGAAAVAAVGRGEVTVVRLALRLVLHAMEGCWAGDMGPIWAAEGVPRRRWH